MMFLHCQLWKPVFSRYQQIIKLNFLSTCCKSHSAYMKYESSMPLPDKYADPLLTE